MLSVYTCGRLIYEAYFALHSRQSPSLCLFQYCITNTLKRLQVQFPHLSLQVVEDETLCGVLLEVLYERSLTLADILRALYFELSQSWCTSCLGAIAMIVDRLHYTFRQPLQKVSCDVIEGDIEKERLTWLLPLAEPLEDMLYAT